MQYEPHDYQKYATEQIVQKTACGLFLDMGLGKTVSALTAINELIYDRFDVARVLVIAPLRVAETTWTDEAKKWNHLHGLIFSRILGDRKERTAGATAEADVYLINRENVVWLVDNFGDKWKWDMVVIDESVELQEQSGETVQGTQKGTATGAAGSRPYRDTVKQRADGSVERDLSAGSRGAAWNDHHRIPEQIFQSGKAGWVHNLFVGSEAGGEGSDRGKDL